MRSSEFCMTALSSRFLILSKNDQYYKTLRDLIRKEENIYEALTTDLYYLGKVLNRKYTLLRITYTIFTVGILASVIAFVLAFKGIGF